MKFKEYIKELSIVILGILIAFWVSNLGTRYQERATQKQVLQTILNELEDNNGNIETTLQSLDSLQLTYTRIQSQNLLPERFIVKYSGLSLRSIGYETAKYTGILKDISYNLTSKIVENYESQAWLEETEKQMVEELFVLIKNKSHKAEEVDFLILQISNIRYHLLSFNKYQKQLIEELKNYLKIK